MSDQKTASDSWGKHTLAATVDSTVPDKAFRILCLISVHGWKNGETALGYTEIAQTLGYSQRHTIRAIRTLIDRGYLSVSRRHNCRNSYVLQEPSAKSQGGAGAMRCPGCERPVRALGPAGLCRSCVRQVNIERELSALLARNPELTEEQAYLTIKTHGAKAIRLAWRKLTREVA